MKTVRLQSTRSFLKSFAFILLLAGSLACFADTYYVDYEDGDDSNSGTSKNSAWKRHPFMRGFSGSYEHTPGDRYLFKGGVVWPNECMSLYITKGGTSSQPDYYGVDQSWFSAEAWSRPVFDCGGTSIPDQRPSGKSPVFLRSASYVRIDNITIENWPIEEAAPSDCAGVGISNCSHITIKNCLIRNWVVKVASDGNWGGVANWGASSNISVEECVITAPSTVAEEYRSSNDGLTSGCGTYGRLDLVNCDISGTTQGAISPSSVSYSKIHSGGNSFDSKARGTGVWLTNDAEFFNNLVYDWEKGIPVSILPGWGGRDGTTEIVNNVIWVARSTPLSISNQGNIAATDTKAIVHNNTFMGGGFCIRLTGGGSAVIDLVDIRNNLLIQANSQTIFQQSQPGELIQTNNVLFTAAEASARGLAEANLFKPATAIDELVAQGVALEQFGYPFDFNRAPRGEDWDVGAYQFGSTAGSPPEAPSGLAGGIESNDKVRLSWQDNSTEETAFVVERAPGSDGDFEVLASVGPDVTTHLDENLSPSTTYRYRVKSRNAFGDSAYSLIFEITTGGSPPPAEVGFLNADEGTIAAPFVVKNGAIEQGVDTTDLSGGTAKYTFMIEEAGEFAVVAEVHAPDTNSNSFFVNVDAMPDITTAVWNIPVAEGFKFHPVTWHAKGELSHPGADAKLFHLAPGEHTVFIVGREADTKLRKIGLHKPPSLPKNFTIEGE